MLLKRNIRTIRGRSSNGDNQCYDAADNIRYKKLRSKSDGYDDVDDDDVNQQQMEKEQIHLIANLLDLLEVGGSDSVLGMVDVIKLAQLTVSYFFWSLYEKSNFAHPKLRQSSTHFNSNYFQIQSNAAQLSIVFVQC